MLKKNFRFKRTDLQRLRVALRFPHELKTDTRVKTTGMECRLVVLRRLTYPCRWSDLVPFFGRQVSELSLIFRMGIDHLFSEFGVMLQNLNQPWFAHQLQDCVAAVHRKGSPLANCFGFIDGTVRPMCRPTHNHRLVYNGHKRCHALKYQGVMLANGIMGQLAGPYEGRRHNAHLNYDCGIEGQVPHGFCLYGDPAYPLRGPIIAPFLGLHLTAEQELFNKNMSSVRQSVEWGFGKVLQLFPFPDYNKNLKLFLQPVAKYYIVATLLANAHTCLYGSQISTYFGLNPPNLEAYLQ